MKKLNELEQKYFDLRYPYVPDNEDITRVIKKDDLIKELNINLEELEILKKSFSKFHKLYMTYYNNSRKELFKDPIKFMSWFEEQHNKCGYCDITDEELKKIAKFRGKNSIANLTLNGKKKRSKGTLEIERKDSVINAYTLNNVILACPLCNNAKSNLIDEDGWKMYFVPAMKEYYNMLLKQIETDIKMS